MSRDSGRSVLVRSPILLKAGLSIAGSASVGLVIGIVVLWYSIGSGPLRNAIWQIIKFPVGGAYGQPAYTTLGAILLGCSALTALLFHQQKVIRAGWRIAFLLSFLVSLWIGRLNRTIDAPPGFFDLSTSDQVWPVLALGLDVGVVAAAALAEMRRRRVPIGWQISATALIAGVALALVIAARPFGSGRA